jgi:hypothetical protein
MVCLGEPALLDWNDDRLAFLGNKEIDSPGALCGARVPDEVNSLVRIGAERPRFHHVRRAAFRLMGQRTFEHVKKFRSGMIVLRADRSLPGAPSKSPLNRTVRLIGSSWVLAAGPGGLF